MIFYSNFNVGFVLQIRAKSFGWISQLWIFQIGFFNFGFFQNFFLEIGFPKKFSGQRPVLKKNGKDMFFILALFLSSVVVVPGARHPAVR